MKRLALPFLAVLAYAAAPSIAGSPPRLGYDLAALDDQRAPSFAAAALGDRELAGMVGTGAGPALDERTLAGIVMGSNGQWEDVSMLVSTQRNFDRSMIAGGTSEPIDAWWAQVGAELIAANLL